MESGADLGRRLAAGDRSAAPAALNLIEGRTSDAIAETAALMAKVSPAALGHEPAGQIVGVTGPPGAGKSTLLSELVRAWRSSDKTVAILAVDPSSKRSGGALLGDRARIQTEAGDDGILIRSTATATRLGGLAPATRESALVLAAAFDVVVIETVGVGQSETDVAEIADTVVVAVQPASGDILQFLKAGVMEVPDLLVVTKSDLGVTATRSASDLSAALRALGATDVPVLKVSSLHPVTGIDDLIDAVAADRTTKNLPDRRSSARRNAALALFVAEFGDKGLRDLGGTREARERLARLDGNRDPQWLFGQLRELATDANPPQTEN